MVDYGAAIKRPFTDLKKLVIGVILSIIPIVNFLAFGFELKCAKSAMGKKFELPEWKDWGGLFVKGLLAVVIGIVYMIPAGIVMFLVAATFISTMMAGSMAGQVDPGVMVAGLMGGMGIGILVFLLLLLLTVYVLPSAMMSFVSKDSFGAAFSFGEVFKKAFTVKYLVVWIVAVIYSMIVGAILSWIPFIGWGISSFLGGVTSMTLYGEVYSEL